MQAQALIDKLLAQGGFSVNPQTGDSPALGYMVSVAPERCKALDAIDAQILSQFVEDNGDYFSDSRSYLGAWASGGKYYLDVSVNVRNLDYALQLAKTNRQKAIFDLYNHSDISVEDSQ